jgi:hypothetical protein
MDVTAESALLLMTGAAALLSVSVILLKCLLFGQVKPGRIGAVVTAFVVGAVLNALLFRFLAFP